MAAAVVAALMVGPLSGCAVIARAATAAEIVGAAREFTEPSGAPRDPVAVVTGTNGSGLRLNAEPGSGRLGVLPDGTAVAVLCRAQGPLVTRRWHESATWTRVRTADGAVGWLADSYLDVDAPGGVPAC